MNKIRLKILFCKVKASYFVLMSFLHPNVDLWMKNAQLKIVNIFLSFLKFIINYLEKSNGTLKVFSFKYKNHQINSLNWTSDFIAITACVWDDFQFFPRQAWNAWLNVSKGELIHFKLINWLFWSELSNWNWWTLE